MLTKTCFTWLKRKKKIIDKASKASTKNQGGSTYQEQLLNDSDNQ